jgi:HK97 family phage major capsid protein
MQHERNRLVTEQRMYLDGHPAGSAEDLAILGRMDAAIGKLERQLHRSRPSWPQAPDLRPDRDGVITLAAGGDRRFQLWPGELPDLHRRASRGYEQNFLGYLRGKQALGLQVTPDNKGGYAVPLGMVSMVLDYLDKAVSMRQLALVLPPMPQAAAIHVPVLEDDGADADWTEDVPTSDIQDAGDEYQFGDREFIPHLMARMIKVSDKFDRSAAAGALMLVSRWLASKFARTEEKGFLTGDGNKKPLGVFVASDQGIPTSCDVTASSATAFTGDDVLDTFHGLAAQFIANATWIMHPAVLAHTRKLKDGNGAYLLALGQGGEPDGILGRPVRLSDYAPGAFTAGQYTLVVGDFAEGYMIADSLEMNVQRLSEKFVRTSQIGYIGRKETDGSAVRPAAFRRLRLAS